MAKHVRPNRYGELILAPLHEAEKHFPGNVGGGKDGALLKQALEEKGYEPVEIWFRDRPQSPEGWIVKWQDVTGEVVGYEGMYYGQMRASIDNLPNAIERTEELARHPEHKHTGHDWIPFVVLAILVLLVAVGIFVWLAH